MNRSAGQKPFSFRSAWIMLALLIIACADTPKQGEGGPNYYNYASLSRTDGLAYGHFSSKVSIYSNYFTQTTSEWIDGLPAGFTYSSRTIQGDDPGPGQWQITIHWKAIDTRDNTEKQWSQSFELRFFTKLEENR